MYIATFQHPHDFLARAEQRLLEQEVANSLLLGIARTVSKQPTAYGDEPPYLATVEEGGDLLLAAVMTPPQHLLLASTNTDYSLALQVLTLNLLNNKWQVSGVGAPTQLASDFAHVWQAQAGVNIQIETHERLFVLHEVNPPASVDGSMRQATIDDLSTISQWIAAFEQEAHAKPRQQSVSPQVRAQRRIEQGEAYVWTLPDGEVVALAATTRPLNTTISIGPVYTPSEFRSKGYATNLVATLSQSLLDQGWKTCNLFTDLANPISNHIYMRIGYDPVTDFDQYAFS